MPRKDIEIVWSLEDVPPRIDYKLTDSQVKGKTLLDLQMAPSVVFLVRWQNSALNGEFFPHDGLSRLYHNNARY